MAKQKEQSRKNWKGSGEAKTDDVFRKIAEQFKQDQANQGFLGYRERSSEDGKVSYIWQGDSLIDRLDNEDEAYVVFDKTPFYGEGGGQVGDKGHIEGEGAFVHVLDSQKPVDDIIVLKVRLQSGSLEVGKKYLQTIDESRSFIQRNHTATHLLHGALRKVLGDHVKQSGSLVNADMLRFDFAHFNAMTRDELDQVEEMVNREIWSSYPVVSEETTKDEAVAAGAIAFFGEKYGDTVRVIKAGSYSVELCGGTHVPNTGDIQLFKIASEGAIAAGVRRIVAYTSKRAYEFMNERFVESRETREIFKAGSGAEVKQRLTKLLDSEKDLRRKLEQYKSQQMAADIDVMISNAASFGGGKLISKLCPADPKGVKYLRDMSDLIRNKAPDSVVILGMKNDEVQKAFILAAVGKDVSAKISASDMIKELAPLIDGRGGGKPDLAQAGGTNLGGLDKAMSQAQKLAESQLGAN